MAQPHIKVRLRGDQALAAKYLTVCQTRALWLEDQRKIRRTPVITMRYHFEPGVNAMVEAAEWGITIDISAVTGCSVWMDSGLVNLGVGAITSANPASQDPGVIYLDSDFGTLPRGQIKTSSTASSGYVSGSGASVDGGPTAAYRIPPNADGTTPNDPVLPLKKNNSANAPASCYSGLMRVFVQALYGHKFTDADATKYTVNTGDVPTVTMTSTAGSFTIGNNLTNSTGLYLDTSYTPWFIQITNGTTVRVRQATLTGCADSVRKTLLKKFPDVVASKFDNTRNALVAIMLSQVNVDYSGFNQTFGTGFSIAGAPLAYGWSFNKNGDTAEIVTHASATSGGLACWAASRYKLQILRDLTKDVSQYPADQQELHRWTVTPTLVSSAQLWNFKFGAEYVWVPYWGNNQLQLTTYYSPLTGQLGAYPNVVIHLMYQPQSDTPLLIQAQKTATGQPATGRSISQFNLDCGGGDPSMLAFPSENASDTNLTVSNTTVLQVQVGATSYNFTEYTGAARNTWSLTGSLIGVPPVTGPATLQPGDTPLFGAAFGQPSSFVPGCPPLDNTVWEAQDSAYNTYVGTSSCQLSELNNSFFRTYFATAQITQDNDSGLSASHKFALILPYYDCTSVYVFENSSESASRNHIVSQMGYPAVRYYCYTYYDNIPPCVFNHQLNWFVDQLRARPSTDVFTQVANSTSSYGTFVENAYAYLGDTNQQVLPGAVATANKANLLSPSISNPYHDTPFFTHTAGVMGGYAGEGLLGGGYTVPSPDSISRYLLTFVGFA